MSKERCLACGKPEHQAYQRVLDEIKDYRWELDKKLMHEGDSYEQAVMSAQINTTYDIAQIINSMMEDE